jgi:hypothetical protein
MADQDDIASIEATLRGPVRSLPALQEPGKDEVIRKTLFPDHEGDRRLYVDTHVLHRLLDVAQSSPGLRAVLHNVKLSVTQYRAKNGHVYEVWAFEGGPLVPELTQAEQTVIARQQGG